MYFQICYKKILLQPGGGILCALLFFLSFTLLTARRIEFETTEVTSPQITISPDGQWVILTILGHLFRLPVEGGNAKQLTFGPYYDSDPAISPNGTLIAFVSDRDGSQGNIFVLDLETSQISQLTHESAAGRPIWTPDGKAVVYLEFRGDLLSSPFNEQLPPSVIKRASLSGAEPLVLNSFEQRFYSLFFLPDGRLGWTRIVAVSPDRSPFGDREEFSDHITYMEALDANQTIAVLGTLQGVVERATSNPAGDGIYCLRGPPLQWDPEMDELLFFDFAEQGEELITLLPPHQRTSFAVARDNQRLYFGDSGRLWELERPFGLRRQINFQADIKLEVQEPTNPPTPDFERLSEPRTVLSPRLSPDGDTIIFVAFGYLWKSTRDGGPARRLTKGSAIERDPTFSPNGRYLAYVRSQGEREEIVVLEVDGTESRVVASGPSLRQPNWSPDGRRLVFTEYESPTYRIISVDLREGGKNQLAETQSWNPRPHFSADGQSVYYCTTRDGATGALYRLPITQEGEPTPITQLTRHVSDALVSPDETWLAFRRNAEIWVARRSRGQIRDEDLRLLSSEGGKNFAFSPDAGALIYSTGNRVWHQRLESSDREELPINIEIPTGKPRGLLLRRVRILDYRTGSFSPETSLLIDNQRIKQIGEESGSQQSAETDVVDAEGRYAIPGLFDLHVHLWQAPRGASQAAFLAYGVTSIRDPGGDLTWLNTLADRSQAGDGSVPRYFYSGDLFDYAQSVWDQFLLISNEDEARAYVRLWKQRGAQFLKVYSLPWPLKRVISEEARSLGLPILAHGVNVEEVTKGVHLGFYGLEHLDPGNRYYADILQLLLKAGTRWEPTLSIAGGSAVLQYAEPERFSDSKLRAFDEWRATNCSWVRNYFRKGLLGLWVETLDQIGEAHRIGVKLQVGTDAAQVCVFHGASLHWELEYFVQAGLTPLEALQNATQEAAAAVAADEDLGTLEPGKLADIVLLDANPLEDIRNTQKIWRVIKGGQVFDPEQLRPDRARE